MKYSTIYILFNPKSTGPSLDAAKNLKTSLKKHLPASKISLIATKYPGHAEKLAYQIAKKSSQPLIVSSSGDGGYNEVINGAIKAQLEGAKPVCAVLPAGNANDHSRTVQKRPLSEEIVTGKVSSLDVLEVDYSHRGHKFVRYAHSYIGLGLTPKVAAELNKTKLNRINELWVALRTFLKFRPVKVKIRGRVVKLDSLVFTNIGEMAKVLTVSTSSKSNDGYFEVIKFPHTNRLNLLRHLAKATVTGLETSKKYKDYEFVSTKKTLMQLDGELQYVDQDSMVRVAIRQKLLKTII